MPLPESAKGYRVDRSSGVVHSRYAEHAASLPRTKTEAGVRQLLDGRVPGSCPECFPLVKAAPPKRQPSRPARVRTVVDVTPVQAEPQATHGPEPEADTQGEESTQEAAHEPEAGSVDEGA
jgi:hypothetical protein